MINLQPWKALKTLLGYSSTGEKQQIVKPLGLQNLALNLYAYGKDPLSAWYSRRMHLTQDRLQAYKEFDDMDSDDTCVSALDLYAEDATQSSPDTAKKIWIEAEDEEVETLCNAYLERINADGQVFSVARELAKYGNTFSANIQAQKDDGTPGQVLQLIPAPVYAMSRIEDDEGRLIGFTVAPIEQLGHTLGIMQPSDMTSGQPTDPPWAFIHWRLLGMNRIESYGTSLLWPARRPYRRLRMAEDALVIYRLKKSPDRFVFEITGLSGMSPEDRNRAMRKIRQELRKKHLIDQDTGVRSEMQPIGIDEDIIVDGEAVKVSRLTGSSQINHVTDVDYLRKRFYGALKIPPDYMGFSDAKSGFIAESPLSYQDINFARVIKRLQFAVMEGYALGCQVNMCWLGVDPKAGVAKFTVHMNPVSALDEKNRLELERVRAETLEILQKIGAALGIDTDGWHAYLLQRSRIPTYLLRVNGRKKGDLLKGKVVVQEKLQQIIESKKDLVESINHKILESTTIPEDLKRQFNHVMTERISLKRFVEVTHITESGNRNVKFEEMPDLVTLAELFSPARGSNTFHSDNLATSYDTSHLPLHNKVGGKLEESRIVTTWKSEKKKKEIQEAKNLMSETIKKLQEEEERVTARQKKLEESKNLLEERYGIDSEELLEFNEEEEDEEDTD